MKAAGFPRRAAPAALAGLAVLWLEGCAGLAPAPRPTATATAPSASAPRPGPASHTAAAAPVAVPTDSGPSAEALAVLATIPDPLPPGERVPAAAESAASRPDSAGAESARVEVPVPAPTVPLGERPGPATQALPESALVPRERPAPPAAATVNPDSCWRLQVGAPPEKEKAAALEKAASSQLLVPFVTEREKGRSKVRTRDCMDRKTVDALRLRAERSGFKGAFPFRGKKR